MSILYRDPQLWIVFTYAGRELRRIPAAEAAQGESAVACAELAVEYGCPRDEIAVSLEEV